ncbi:MAG: TetR/AcrR family transcriptional regulator [Salinirussus sp.]
MGVEVDGEPKDAIMRATYRALRDHGYADLTMQAIADEAPVSKATLHYHYDSKRGLVKAFQSYISQRFVDRIEAADDPEAAPPARLRAVLDAVLESPADDDCWELQRILLDLKARAAHDPAIRADFQAIDTCFRDLLADILQAGVESGDFRSDIDAEATARFIVTALAGAGTRAVSVGQSPDTTRELLQMYVDHAIAAGRTSRDE